VRRVVIPFLAVAAAIMATVSGLIVAYGETGPQGFAAVTVTAARPTPTASATPTPVPVPASQRLVGRGRNRCGAGPSSPLPSVVYGGSYSGPQVNEVALTFDDGPTPYSTPSVLSYLEQSRTPATFFVEGQYIHEWPYLLEREWNDGFAIGVHTWDHPLMTRLSIAGMNREIADTISAFNDVLGFGPCLWFWRPPYGDYNGTVVQVARGFSLSTIMWDVDPRDWSRPGVQQIVSRVLAQAHPGAIILMHDGPALRDQTAAALPQIVASLRARGLTPVRLPKLLADERYPGVKEFALPPAPRTPQPARPTSRTELPLAALRRR
jgi:peptidoglycan/xylan/chitin deacetylase (PgdA/CDA1 family)